jgi:prepilin-type N-terminal cleavage/methylation domain-containing protein
MKDLDRDSITSLQNDIIFMKKHGFTLIELIVVMAIIAILAILSISLLGRGVFERARDGRRKSDLESIRGALEIYKADAKEYPDSPLPGCGVALTYTMPSGTVNTYITKMPCDPSDDTVPYSYIVETVETFNYKYTLGTMVERPEVGDNDECGGLSCGGSECNYCIFNP